MRAREKRLEELKQGDHIVRKMQSFGAGQRLSHPVSGVELLLRRSLEQFVWDLKSQSKTVAADAWLDVRVCRYRPSAVPILEAAAVLTGLSPRDVLEGIVAQAQGQAPRQKRDSRRQRTANMQEQIQATAA